MKTVVILSDSHGRRKNVEKLFPLFAENDYVIHLGDGSADVRDFSRENPQKCLVMKGNCDFSYGMDEYVLETEGVRILCCHGHKYGVKSGLSRLVAHAKECGCDVALYGHTHRADICEEDGVLCVNPGSLGDFFSPSYCYLVLHEKKATPTIVPLQ